VNVELAGGVILDLDAVRRVQKEAHAMLDALSAVGLGDKEIGLILLGMAASALEEGGVTREQMHALVDRILDERAPS
jgi:hypothetical protein